MDNDNKIDTKNDVMLFLEEELVSLKKKDKVITYDLVTEYAKTKKNRLWSIWLVLFLTIVGVGGITYFTSAQLQRKNRSIEVNLDAFEDINLKNLFDAMSKTQDLYEKAAKNKAEIQAAYDARIDAAKKRRDADLKYIAGLKIKRSQIQERQTRVWKNYNAVVDKVHQDLDEKLKAADIELKQYEEQLKGFDSETVSKAQEYEQQIDSERQIHELEKDRIAKDYEEQIDDLNKKKQEDENKLLENYKADIAEIHKDYKKQLLLLDPVIKDSKERNILKGLENIGYTDSIKSEDFAGDLNDAEFNQALKVLKNRYDEYIYLNTLAANLPYKNSMPEVIRGERRKAYEMAKGISLAGASRISALKEENNKLYTKIDKLTGDLSQQKSAFDGQAIVLDTCAMNMGVDGFILTTGSKPVVFIKSGKRQLITQDGSVKAVIKQGERKITTGALWFKDSVYYFSPDDKAVIQPGYSIVIN